MNLPRSSHTPFSPLLVGLALLLALASSAWASTGLVCSPANLRFGTVALNQSETQVLILTNNGSTSVEISKISTSSKTFAVSGVKLPLTLASGASTAVNVTFTPTEDGWLGGTVTFTSNASNPSLEIAVGGVGVRNDPLNLSPASLSFGQVAVGTQIKRSVVVTNPNSWTENLTALQVGGTGFSASASLPVTLKKGQSVTLTVTFSPKAAGESAGRVFIVGPSTSIPMTGTGTGIGTLAVNPSPLNFGNVMVGESTTQTLVLSATGSSITITSAASSNSQFVLSGITLPLTISPSQPEQVNVVFTPTASGGASGKLSFVSNASDATDLESMTGTGTSPQVSLAWEASSSSVQGYNVYRGSAPGSYSKLNSKLDTSTSYTDTTVATGKTYYYAATSVSSSGQESAYSSPVKVVIP